MLANDFMNTFQHLSGNVNNPLLRTKIFYIQMSLHDLIYLVLSKEPPNRENIEVERLFQRYGNSGIATIY